MPGLRSRILLLAALVPLAGALVVLLAGFWLHRATLDQRREAVRYVTDAAVAAVADLEARARRGELPEADARRMALDMLRSMRFRNGEEYFYVWHLDTLQGVMHPIRPDLEGTDGGSFRDRNGLPVIRALREVAMSQGNGFQAFTWPKPTDPMGPDHDKIGYVVAFEPWRWMIGSGIYVDDVDDAFLRAGALFALLGAIVVASSFTVAWRLGRWISRPLEHLNDGVRAIADGRLDIEVHYRGREDEIGAVARSLEVLRRRAVETEALKRTAEERLVAVARNLAALDAAGDGIEIFGRDGGLLHLNPSMARMLGYADTAEVRRECAEDPRHCPLHDWFWSTVWPVLSSGGSWTGEAAFTGIDGKRRLAEVSFTRLPDGDAVGIFRDVTERRALEARLRQSEKMEAIGRLAGGIAHDFNNLLGAILGFASFLQEDAPEGSAARNFSGRILKAGNRAKELVEQILAYSRARGIERGPVLLEPVLAEAAKMMRHTLPSSTRLEVAPAGPLAADANATQLLQILMNLCLNASEAMAGEAGRVTVSVACATQEETADLLAERGGAEGVEPLPAPDGQVLLRFGRLEPCRSYVRLRVEDDGPGIPPDIAPRLFEPFFTTKGMTTGTGLGLSVVHGVVVNHRGALVLRSAAGGTRVDVFLPAAVPETADDVPPPAAARLPEGTRVLVVDDAFDVADMVAITLERHGCEVAVCNDAQQALDAFVEDPAAWDVVVTDQVMPDLKGTELIRRLRRLRRDLPTILCTGYSETLSEEAAHAAGADLFLRKPVLPADLVAAVRGLLSRDPLAAREVAGAPE
ncbi:MAG TPA: cache domain-containing protein [Azospirillaceae bacterium]|nr:cache domain-containing protein [Azospirillaceae bacterium]